MTAPIQPSFVGVDQTLYYNSGTFVSPVWALVDCRDLKKGLTRGEAEVGGRGTNMELYEPTRQKRQYVFDMIEDETDAAYVAIRAAFFSNSAIEFAFANGPIGTAGTSGTGGTTGVVYSRLTCKVFGFETDQPLDNGCDTSISVKPCRLVKTQAPTDNAIVS